MRRPLLFLTLMALACARFGQAGSATTTTVIVPADSALRAARATLTAEGWTVNDLGNGRLATAPRPVPAAARTSAKTDQNWMIQVVAERLNTLSGSRVIVAGYVIPDSASMPVDSTTISRAIPVTSEHPVLWGEVRGLANRIARAADRRR